MKTKDNKLTIQGIILILFLVSITASFRPYFTNQTSTLILGTWICSDTPEWKLQFNSNGIMKNYLNGVVTKSFSYSITSEKSINGKYDLSFLKIINVSDANDVREYEITGMTKTEMFLDYLGDTSVQVIGFTKQ